MPDPDSIRQNLDDVEARIQAAVDKAGRKREEVELMVVSKTWPAEVIQLVVECGHTLFGENKVQEGMAKIPQLPSSLLWHLIGHLQKNKIRKALPLFSTIHSIDSLELAQQVNRIAEEEGLYPDVYLEVNLAEEASKYGFTAKGLREHMEEVLELDRLGILGLMIIPPATAAPEESRPFFRQLREYRDDLEKEFGLRLDQLSMGMSSDYTIAIEEGSTIVRVGSAIFGPRDKKA